MTRKFRVTIGGISYLVDVEEVGAAAAAPVPPAPPAPAAAPSPVPPAPVPAAPVPPAPVAAAAARQSAPATATVAGEAVRAPLPGMVAAIRCAVGQQVARGQVLAVLEAMKMENEITAPTAGTVTEVLVERGATVSVGDVMVVIG